MSVKHTIRWTLLAIFAFATSVVSAQVSPVLFEVTPQKGGQFQEIHFLGANEGNVNLQLFDAKGNLIFQTTERKTLTVDKLLDLRQLPYGNYTLKCQGSGMRFTEDVSITSEKSPYEFDLSMNANQRVNLKFVGEQADDATVKVLNSDGVVLYEGPLTLNEENVQVFELRAINDPYVTFVVGQKGENLHKGIRLK